MLDQSLPDLTFPGVNFGPSETPWNLRRWIYRGGARSPVGKAESSIDSGMLGPPLVERIELVRLIHESILNYVESGRSRASAFSDITLLTYFFRWIDETADKPLSVTNVEDQYRRWCDALLHRVRVKRDLKEQTAYSYAAKVGAVFDKVLERGIPIVRTCQIKPPRSSLRAVGIKADKQNLEDTFAFGHFLLDLADALSVDSIWGPLPLIITLRNGTTLEEWAGLKRSNTLKPPNPKYPHQHKYIAKKSSEHRTAWEAEKSYRTRYSLINLRIMAEMFMLMGQPGVNLAQVHQLRMDQWRFKSSNNGYEIRTFKQRRLGTVVFEIYSEYRSVFERYLEWRKIIFPDDPDGLLFPFLGFGGGAVKRRLDTPPNFSSFIARCKRAGVVFVGPQALRSTNVNWLLRRTADPDLTANEKQHAKKTLLTVYEKPSLQRAMVQTQLFWAKYDPALEATGPGSCVGKAPEPIEAKPLAAAQPDCLTPAGCLFCIHQRDIDNFDYVWSLASFRLLKSFELRANDLTKSNSATPNPAELAIERITAKLDTIKASSAERARWVEEALVRLEEGRYHHAWAGLIESL